jgi:hypothetical protein
MWMIEISVNQTRSNHTTDQSILDEPVFHDEYDVKTEKGSSVGINLLYSYYGELWVSAMNRLNHKIDGHLFDIRHVGIPYGVYRKVKPMKLTEHPYLRLVKKK